MASLGPARRNNQNVPPGCPLSDREHELLCLVAEGLSVVDAAAKLGVAMSSARLRVRTAYRRLGVHDAESAVQRLAGEGWLDRQEGKEFELSPFLQAYLAAFDKHLRRRDDRSRRAMRIALLGAVNDRDLRVQSRPAEDPLDGVVDALIGQRGRPPSRPA